MPFSCSIVLDRDEDMQITGQRHAFMARYKVGRARRPAAGGAAACMPASLRSSFVAAL